MTDFASIVEHFDGPILAIPFRLIHIIGDIKVAAFLKQAAYLSAISRKKEGWFDLQQVGDGSDVATNIFGRLGSWQYCLGLSRDEQAAIRKKLVTLGLLEEERKGVPARLHFRVDLKKYIELITSNPDSGNSQILNGEKSESRFCETPSLVVGNAAIYSIDRPNINNPPPPASLAVEVVVDFPPNINSDLYAPIKEMLGKVSGHDQQAILDDLSGWISTQTAVGKVVRNPVAVLTKIINRYISGGNWGESSHIGRQMRSIKPQPVLVASRPEIDPDACAVGRRMLNEVKRKRIGESEH